MIYISYDKLLKGILNKEDSSKYQMEIAFSDYSQLKNKIQDNTLTRDKDKDKDKDKVDKDEILQQIQDDLSTAYEDDDKQFFSYKTVFSFISNQTKKVSIESYYDTSIVNTTPSTVKKIIAAQQKVSEKEDLSRSKDEVHGRRSIPLNYYEYMTYEHRKDATFGRLRIGDVEFTVPPEFITVTTSTPSETINSLRKRGSIKVKRGYTRKNVTVQLFVTGANQINGFKVDAPGPSYHFFVDGLRPLLAQFITTPFVPVMNEMLNQQHDIFTVALNNIIVSTIDGFPNSYEVHINMEAVTLVPYTETPDCLYEDMINWDLYRFNYQRLLVGGFYNVNAFLPPMRNFKNSTLRLKILDREILEGIDKKSSDKKIYDDKNFITQIDTDKDAIEVTGISLSMANNIPLIQLGSLPYPTAQYMGSSDTNFNIILETTDSSDVYKLKMLTELSQQMTRDNKEFGLFGFIKIENELINMTGVEYVVVENIQVSTVPEFPGLYKIVLTMIEFDHRQKERENLIGMTPFDDSRKGTKEDAISQNIKGILNKIAQDNVIEAKMSTIELYPDLFLPTYEEVNDYMIKAHSFRRSYGLPTMRTESLSPSYSIIPGGGHSGTYNLFVDPDYYLHYPLDYNALDDSIFEQFKPPKEAKTVSTIGRTLGIGDDLSDLASDDSGGNNSDGTTNQTTGEYKAPKETGNELADLLIAKQKQGCGYVWGADGQWATSGAWAGKQVFDCSGFISWGLRELGLMQGRTNDVGLMSSTYSTPISRSELRPGDFVRYPGHIAVYIGDNKTVEAANSKKGVIIGNLRAQYTQFARPKGVRHYGVNNRSIESQEITGRSKTLQQARRPDIGTGNDEQKYTSYTKYDVPQSRIDALGKHLSNKLAGTEESWVKAGHKYNVNPILMVSIANSETGHGKILNYNNPGGLMANGGHRLMRFNTLDEGIDYMTKNIRNGYLNQGLDTIPKIGNKYCPVGASNDPNGTNVHWIPMVTSMFKTIAGKEPGDLTYKGFDGVSSNYTYNGSASSSGSSGETIKIDKTKWDGKVIGDTSKYLDIKNFGKPIYEESPIIHIFSSDKVIEKEAEKQAKENEAKNKKSKDDKSRGFKDMMETVFKWVSWGTVGINPLSHIHAFSGLWDRKENAYDILGVEGVTGKFDKNLYENTIKNFYLNSDRQYKSMFCDMMMYSRNGTMCKAFPTYMFLIADDSGDWLDGRRLWNNFYSYKSILSVEIHQEKCQPMHTAKITATNIHHNLNSKMKNVNIEKSIKNDPEYSKLVRKFYDYSGSLLGTPKLTQSKVDSKNKLFDIINLKPGARVHIRLGYGSNPIMLPITFNGIVSDISVGDVIEIVAESFGSELISSIISDDKEDSNGVFDMGSEPTNLIYSVLKKRDHSILNFFNKKWGEGSKFGIEHFGLLRDHTILDTKDREKDYDLMKNIYFARYEGVPFCMSTFGWFDGEDNTNFYLYNKTPWDACQLITQSLPEFVCQPMYHQFDCRLFFGLPYWLSKYRYDINEKSVFESAKTFAQFHYADSMTDIIDNRVMTTKAELFTNCIAMYTRGEAITSTPTIYSDRSMYSTNHRTKIVDTTLNQDYIGPDWLYEKTVLSVAKSSAIKVAVSNLIDAWNKSYAGEVIMLGDATIKPCDYFYMNDMYSSLYGLSTVREVVHSLSSNGFTTSVYPELIAISTMKNSGQGNIIKSLTSFGISYSAVKSAREAMIKNTNTFTMQISIFRSIASLRNSKENVVYNAIEGAIDIYLGKKMLGYIKNAKMFLKFKDIASTVGSMSGTVITAIKGLSAVKKLNSIKIIKATTLAVQGGAAKMAAIGTAVAPGIGTLVGYLIGAVVFDFILGAIIDEFAYNNSIKVFPLVYKDGAFVTGCGGQSKLVVGVAETGEKLEETNNESNNGNSGRSNNSRSNSGSSSGNIGSNSNGGNGESNGGSSDVWENDWDVELGDDENPYEDYIDENDPEYDGDYDLEDDYVDLD